MWENSRPPPTVLFTLRLWRETLDETRCEWRGAVKNLTTGEVRYFRNWQEISVLVPNMLPDNSEL